MENIQGTVFDFALVLRQMYTEDILRERLDKKRVSYHGSMECVGFEISLDDSEYPVTVHCSGPGGMMTAKRYAFYRKGYSTGSIILTEH